MMTGEVDLPREVDVIVVGAGRAGLAFSTVVAPHMRCLAVDALPLPRRKLCTALLVEEGQEALARFGLHIPMSAFVSPAFVSRSILDFANDEVFCESARRIANLDQFAFDEWLLETAIAKGAEVVCGHPVSILDETPDGFRVGLKTKKGQRSVASRFVVGADGPNSFMRRTLKQESLPHYVGAEFGCSLVADDFIQVFGGVEGAYYAWIIQKDDAARLGFALKPGYKPSRSSMFTEANTLLQDLGCPDSLSHFLGSHPITFIPSKRHLYLGSGKLLLVGEAAGWISPSSLDGMSFALRSGFLAGMALLEDEEAPQDEYARASIDLKNEIGEKLRTRQVLEDPDSRVAFLSTLMDTADSGIGSRLLGLEAKGARQEGSAVSQY